MPDKYKYYADLRDLFTPEVIAAIDPVLISEMITGVQPIPASAFRAAHELMKLPLIEPKIILDSSDPENVARLKSEGFVPLEDLHYEEDSGKKEEGSRSGD